MTKVKGFKITFDTDKNTKIPWTIKNFGNYQQLSNFDFGTGEKGVLKCVKCGVIHWKDLENDKSK